MTAKRVLFVINSLGSGGAERVLANLVAAEHARGGCEVHLALLDDVPRMRDVAPLDGLYVMDGRGKLPRSARQLRSLIEKIDPHCVVSFLIRANCATILACAGRKIRTVLCERMHPGSHLPLNHQGFLRQAAAKAAIRFLYPHAGKVLAVSEGVRGNLIDEFGLKPALIQTIPNPFDLDGIISAGNAICAEPLPEEYCVCVGRLVAAKNVSTVLKAFARIRPTEQLVIVGQGPELASLKALARSLQIDKSVRFVGFVDNPFAIVSRARFLISASRNEGFPNAAAEAMALGVPVILTDCPSGPSELLLGGQCGILVPLDDITALESAMLQMMDGNVRDRFSTLALERMSDFSLDKVAAAYWRAFLGDCAKVA